MRPSPTRRVATAAVAVLSAGALSVGFLAAPAEAAADRPPGWPSGWSARPTSPTPTGT